jgi:hypothetical protein
MTDYEITVEIVWDDDGNVEGAIVDVPRTGKTYTYTVDELEGTNLADLINNDQVTVYSQKQSYTPEEHRDIFGW